MQTKKFNEFKRLREETPISDILGIIIKQNHLDVGIDKLDVMASWKKMLGPGVTNYTLDMVFKRNVLYVALSSPIVREELSYGKSKIIALINEDLGREVIKDIIFR